MSDDRLAKSVVGAASDPPITHTTTVGAGSLFSGSL